MGVVVIRCPLGDSAITAKMTRVKFWLYACREASCFKDLCRFAHDFIREACVPLWDARLLASPQQGSRQKMPPFHRIFTLGSRFRRCGKLYCA
ncbi:hypothetical protein [Agrobacterium sp. NPDC089420]|uniref:hypothetical protein n=1 Tax=Agrobacterium sp. NPDC089420 TaxID=3363918 RepID=UPI00384CD8B7